MQQDVLIVHLCSQRAKQIRNRKEYKMKVTDILLPALALLYVISPIDLIPDFVLGIGALDDLAILAFAIPLLLKEVDKFLLWESQKKNPNVIDAEIVE